MSTSNDSMARYRNIKDENIFVFVFFQRNEEFCNGYLSIDVEGSPILSCTHVPPLHTHQIIAKFINVWQIW